MKNPLNYQLSEYDCGPTTILNAISFLFEREDIPPELIRTVMLYSLDCYGPEGKFGECGTSCTAMMFLCNWLCGFGKTGRLPISCKYVTGEDVYIGEGGVVTSALQNGGAVIVRLYYDVAHYVLLTGIKDDSVLMFDPYYRAEPFDENDIIVTLEHPFTYNRIVPFHYSNHETTNLYSLGLKKEREAMILYNNKTPTDVKLEQALINSANTSHV